MAVHLESVSKPLAYTDLPEPLGKVVAEYRIAAAGAIAYPVKAGQYIQIIDVEGNQCSDFLAFAGVDYAEELDGTVTRTLNGLAFPQAGLHGKYFSQRMQPLFEVIQDTCRRHDSFLLAYVLLRASRDLLCASFSCPDDIDPANGWNPTPIHVRIYDAAEEFERAIGRFRNTHVLLTAPNRHL